MTQVAEKDNQLVSRPGPVPSPDAGSYPAILGIRPTTIKEALEIATILANSDLVPKDFRGKAGNVLVAWEMSNALGIPPIQGIQNIAVINGRASIWGELGVAIVQNHPLTKELIFSDMADVKKSGKAWTRHTRRDRPGIVYEGEFTIEDAKIAGLWQPKAPESPWNKYPYWMLQMRANAFCFKRGAADMLKGLSIREESGDIIDLTPVKGEASTYAAPKRASELKESPTPEPAKAPESAQPAQGTVVDAQEMFKATFKVGSVDKANPAQVVITSDPGMEQYLCDIPEVVALADNMAGKTKKIMALCEYRNKVRWILEAEAAK
jgi:hypothetical protein